MYVAYEYLNYASFLITIEDTEKATEILEKAYEIISLTEQQTTVLNIAEYYYILGGLIILVKKLKLTILSLSKSKNP